MELADAIWAQSISFYTCLWLRVFEFESCVLFRRFCVVTLVSCPSSFSFFLFLTPDDQWREVHHNEMKVGYEPTTCDGRAVDNISPYETSVSSVALAVSGAAQIAGSQEKLAGTISPLTTTSDQLETSKTKPSSGLQRMEASASKAQTVDLVFGWTMVSRRFKVRDEVLPLMDQGGEWPCLRLRFTKKQQLSMEDVS